MKKILGAILTTGLLLTSTHHLDANAKGGISPTHEVDESAISSQSLVHPELLTAKNVAALKKGTFKYKGVGLGSTFGQIESVFGKPMQKDFDRMAGITYGDLIYADKKDNIILVFSEEKNKSVNQKDHKAIAYGMVINSPLKFNSIKNQLGQYKSSKFVTGKSVIQRVYGNHLALTLVKEKKVWMVEEVLYAENLEEE